MELVYLKEAFMTKKGKERKEKRSIISSSPLTFQAKGSETSGAAKKSISSIAMPSLLNP